MVQTAARTEEMKHCAHLCTECASICTSTVQHCLTLGGKHAWPQHIRLLLDCADICRTSAGFLLRGSDLRSWICDACSEVCRRCANDCAELADADQIMLLCSEHCRRCAESCRVMSAARS